MFYVFNVFYLCVLCSIYVFYFNLCVLCAQSMRSERRHDADLAVRVGEAHVQEGLPDNTDY